MIRSSTVRKTTIGELAPGDLFRFSYGAGAVLALFLEQVGDEPPKVGIIAGAGFESVMIWLEYSGGPRDCLSYGGDWLIEETHGPETYCGERASRGAAHLYVDDPGLIMVFAPANRSAFGLHYNFDLQDGVFGKLSVGAAPILRWKIWENESHRDSGNAPLFDTENQ